MYEEFSMSAHHAHNPSLRPEHCMCALGRRAFLVARLSLPLKTAASIRSFRLARTNFRSTAAKCRVANHTTLSRQAPATCTGQSPPKAFAFSALRRRPGSTADSSADDARRDAAVTTERIESLDRLCLLEEG